MGSWVIAGRLGSAGLEIGAPVASSDFPSVFAERRVALVPGVVFVVPWRKGGLATVAFALEEIAAASGASCEAFACAAKPSVFWSGFASA